MAENYDWLTSLEKEVERFRATNTFNPLYVTQLYVQAGLCATELRALRSEKDAALALLGRVVEKIELHCVAVGHTPYYLFEAIAAAKARAPSGQEGA